MTSAFLPPLRYFAGHVITVFRQGISWHLDHHFSEGTGSVSSQNPPVFDIPKCWVYKCVSSPLAFTWAGDLSSSPRACAANTVPNGPSLRHRRRHLNKKKQRTELESPHLIPSPALRMVTKQAGTCSVVHFGPFSVGLEHISFHMVAGRVSHVHYLGEWGRELCGPQQPRARLQQMNAF